MLRTNEHSDRLSLPLGITLGLLASFVQSLGLTIQRKSHIQNELLPIQLQRPDYMRPVWLIGFVIYFSFNILGSIFQIGTLPLIILGPLGAISLLWNAILAKFLLGDRFSYHLVLGTLLIGLGAILIGIFGVVPDQDLNHDLDQLIRLYSRKPFVVEILILGLGLSVIAGLAHWTQFKLDRSLNRDKFNLFTIHHRLESPPGAERHQLLSPQNNPQSSSALSESPPQSSPNHQNHPIPSSDSPVQAYFSLKNNSTNQKNNKNNNSSRHNRRRQRKRLLRRGDPSDQNRNDDLKNDSNHHKPPPIKPLNRHYRPVDVIIDSHIPLTPTLTRTPTQRSRFYVRNSFRYLKLIFQSLRNLLHNSSIVSKTLRFFGSNNDPNEAMISMKTYSKRPSPQKVAQLKLLIGIAYGISSGTLSGICLLFAKTGVELLIKTISDHENQFNKVQTWLILLILLISALLQLWYLNKALKLVNPTMICPLAFCFYNLSSIVSSLVYYDQFKLLSTLQVLLICIGTTVLLAGVWVVSLGNSNNNSSNQKRNHQNGNRSKEIDCERNGEESRPLLGSEDRSGSEFYDDDDDDDEVETSVFDQASNQECNEGEDDEEEEGEEEDDSEEYTEEDDEDEEEEEEEEDQSEVRNRLRRSLSNDISSRSVNNNGSDRIRPSSNTIDQIIRQFLTEGEVNPVRGLSIGLGAASPGFAIRPSQRRSTSPPLSPNNNIMSSSSNRRRRIGWFKELEGKSKSKKKRRSEVGFENFSRNENYRAHNRSRSFNEVENFGGSRDCDDDGDGYRRSENQELRLSVPGSRMTE